MFGIAIAIAVPMTFLSKPIILLLFSKSFEPAGAVLAVHIWAAVFVFWGLAQNPWNITEGLTGLYLQRTVMGAVLNVLLNLVLIPLYSSMGAAIATVVAYGFAAFVANAFDPRTKRIFQVQLNSMILRRWSAER
jgi:PST family polysaccharide transporter